MEHILTAEQTLGLILGIIAIAGSVIAYTRYWYKKGGKDTAHIIQDGNLAKKIDDLKKKVDNETKKADEAHTEIHDRIDKTNEKLDNQGKDIAYIKGRIDTFLKQCKTK